MFVAEQVNIPCKPAENIRTVFFEMGIFWIHFVLGIGLLIFAEIYSEIDILNLIFFARYIKILNILPFQISVSYVLTGTQLEKPLICCIRK